MSGAAYGQALCFVQKCMPPALQQTQPPFMQEAVSVQGTKFGLLGHCPSGTQAGIERQQIAGPSA